MKTLSSIQNESDYRKALNIAYELMQNPVEKESVEEERLLQLTSLIEAHEAEYYAIDEQDNPVEVIKFRMEQMNLKNKDVAPIFGGITRVSEYLNEKRPLTMKIIYNLHKYLDIPYDLLIEEQESFALEEAAKRKLVKSLN